MNSLFPGREHGKPRHSAGFTLIELMVAMLLGLIVVAGVISVFLAGQQSYRTNQALGDVQDSSRIAFEMMAQDIRRAGLTGCDNQATVANVLKNGPVATAAPAWWADFNNAVRGYNQGTAGPGEGANRVTATTDSITLIGAQQSGYSIATNVEPAGDFTLNETRSDLASGDVVVVCDPGHTAIVQISGVTNNGKSFSHATGSGTPGNCSGGLSVPTVCTTVGNSYTFGKNSLVAKLVAVGWYIGTNTATPAGTSLYRTTLENTAGVLTARDDEMVRDVTAMRLEYHVAGASSFVNAADPTIVSWNTVDAVRATLTAESVDKRVGVDAKSVSRQFVVTTTLRNRVN